MRGAPTVRRAPHPNPLPMSTWGEGKYAMALRLLRVRRAERQKNRPLARDEFWFASQHPRSAVDEHLADFLHRPDDYPVAGSLLQPALRQPNGLLETDFKVGR